MATARTADESDGPGVSNAFGSGLTEPSGVQLPIGPGSTAKTLSAWTRASLVK